MTVDTEFNIMLLNLCTKLTFLLFLPYVFTYQDSVRNDGIIFYYNNTYKYNVPYTVLVNKSTEYIMEFAGDLQGYDTPARVTVASDSANRTYPLFITARQQKGVFSWQLPMLVQTPVSLEQFTNISRTLCPHNNLFDENEDTCDISMQNTPIVHLTSSSPDTIRVTILVETVEDFYVQLNATTNLTSTPSQPKYYFYPFNQEPHRISDLTIQSAQRKLICNKELNDAEQGKVKRYFVKSNMIREYNWLSKPKSVIVLIESDDDICAVVSIQNFSCPVFDNERDILYDGYYLTMTRRGGITLTQDTFPLGFYIVFIVKTSDNDCIDKTNNASIPKMAHYFGWSDIVNITTNDGRVKTFSFRIIETISYQEYLIAAGAILGFFTSFYVAFLLAIIFQRRKIVASVDITEIATEEDRLSSPSVPHDNVSVPVRAQHQVSAMQGSGGSSSHYWKGEDNDLASSSERNEALVNSSGMRDESMRVPRRRNVSAMQASGESSSRQWLMVNDELTVTPFKSEYSSSSDTESDFSTLDDVNTEKDLCLLGGKLCLVNLSRCRPKVLSKRSNMYLWNVVTVAIFYTLPVIQLVVTYQRLLNQSGNQDLCYFNFLCAHPLVMLSDFNHVYSNLGYVLLGALFLLQVWRRHTFHRAKTPAQKELGIPQHFGLLYAMGIALVSEGLLSAAYHVCPNSMNFQFDTSFMYVTSVLCMVKIYQSRHPDINARAHVTFGVLALIIFIGLVGVLNANFYFWVMFTALHLITCLVMTFQIYYMGRFKPDWNTFCRAARELVTHPLVALTPARLGRCVLLLIANIANWAIAAYGVAQHSRDFASHLLLVLMSNLFLYTLFYIVMKLLYRESIRWYSWIFICMTYSIWFGSSYFYLDQSTNWALTPAQSRQNNRVCSLLQLYDSHDVWHFLSSTAMFFSFNMYLTIDDNLSSVHRKDIRVF